ncbi:hypothetical protein PMAA_091310 [Talaromyces marneffei ATCC 18224]|uniref:Uncharacterized protein n=2 Tax=Talaromyces marneffei TaxID=37727 RepID=B6QJQ6_TALMQ|nr:hypothetical protein PMAA_091310 [Talaromyces marneffei ATCC 18224]
MFGLDAPKITRREFDGSDPQLQLAMAFAASKRSSSTSSSKSASSLTDVQKKRHSFFKAAGTVFSLK